VDTPAGAAGDAGSSGHTVAVPGGHTLTVAPDGAWTALFRRREGWSGGDGIYSAALSGDDSPGAGACSPTLFVFGDTFIGTVDDAGARRPATRMVHNSAAVLEGARPDPQRIRFLWGTAGDGTPAAMLAPATPAGRAVAQSYYWLQDAAVIGRTWYCFPLIVGPDPSGPEGFQFAVHGVARVAVPLRPGALELDWGRQRQVDTPLCVQAADGCRVLFGSAILPNTVQAQAPAPDGHVYVYGCVVGGGPLPPRLVASRVAAEAFADLGAWRFWDGTAWHPEPGAARPIAPAVSPECSVSPLVGGWWHGRYGLVCQLGLDVCLSLGDTPVGPFRDPLVLYRAPEADPSRGVYVYNAKAHPHLADPGELLVSYNVNTTHWEEHLRCADIYRPRFLRVRAGA
jgi:hypothetical protein